MLDEKLRSRPEILLAMALGMAAALGLTLLKFTSEVQDGDTDALDHAILLGLRHATDGNSAIWHGLRSTMIDVTALGNGVTLGIMVALVAGFLFVTGRRGTALFLALQVTAGCSLVTIVKSIVDRGRPDVVDHLVTFRNASFPSGHAADSAIVYLSLAMLVAGSAPKLGVRLYVMISAIILTVLIGVSRVYLGVHWPSDVVAGWAIGSGWALIAALLAQWLHIRASSR
ncbi:MAG: phosphatase PAP2 family protein [Sphingobium sp.]